jgi:hypothetical protein
MDSWFFRLQILHTWFRFCVLRPTFFGLQLPAGNIIVIRFIRSDRKLDVFGEELVKTIEYQLSRSTEVVRNTEFHPSSGMTGAWYDISRVMRYYQCGLIPSSLIL